MRVHKSVYAIAISAFVITSAPILQAQSPAAPEITGLWNTGVDENGAKLAAGENDPHWTLTSVDNPESGAPHCQTMTMPAQAYVTGSNVWNGGSAYVWPYSPTNANWIGARENALHMSSIACPDPSDTSGGTGIEANQNPDEKTWPVWNYKMTDFNIPPQIDLSTVALTITGLVDNYADVYVNGSKIMNLSTTDTSYQSASPTTSAVSGSIFRHGTNSLTVQVKSGYSNQGFVLSLIEPAFKILPVLSITKTASDSHMTVGDEGSFDLEIKNIAGSDGSDTSGTITITDTIPSEFTIGEVPSGCSAVGQAITCVSTTSLKADGSNSWTVSIPVKPNKVVASITNTAYVQGGNSSNCTTATDCSATATVELLPGTPNTGRNMLVRNPIVIIAVGVSMAFAAYILLARNSSLDSIRRRIASIGRQ
jgi:uncharacterized repeat protein (TIGR01451 family)